MNIQNIEDIYVLSPLQEGMLFHSRLAPESGVYVTQLTCTLHGELDPALFERAWQQVVDRHPTLRTSFVWEDVERPVQVAHREVPVLLQKYDWRDESSAEAEERFRAYLRADQESGFDLGAPPLMRFVLIRIAEANYGFLWTYPTCCSTAGPWP